MEPRTRASYCSRARSLWIGKKVRIIFLFTNKTANQLSSFLAAVMIIFIQDIVDTVNEKREPEEAISFRILVSSMTVSSVCMYVYVYGSK